MASDGNDYEIEMQLTNYYRISEIVKKQWVLLIGTREYNSKKEEQKLFVGLDMYSKYALRNLKITYIDKEVYGLKKKEANISCWPFIFIILYWDILKSAWGYILYTYSLMLGDFQSIYDILLMT